MKFNVITIFPELISHYCNETILARAQKNNLIKINPINLRDFTEDKHKTVDDTPYGGGPGMIMKPEAIYKALKKINALPFSKINSLEKLKRIATGKIKIKKRTILLSPRGQQFDQRMAEKFSKLDEITFICGRYEGVDQRVTDYMVDEEISIGNYVLAGGELGALVIIEAVARLIHGVLGNEKSLDEETFGRSEKYKVERKKEESEILNLKFQIDKEYPQYTKPENFHGWKVPKILLSGNHVEIKKWRKNKNE